MSRNFWKNVGTTPRTWSEAKKDATYASPLQHHYNREWEDFKDFVFGVSVILFLVAIAGALASGFLIYLGIIK